MYFETLIYIFIIIFQTLTTKTASILLNSIFMTTPEVMQFVIIIGIDLNFFH